MRFFIYLILAIVLSLFSCKSRNRLKNSEAELSASIQKQEEQQKVTEPEEPVFRPKMSSELRQSENRKVDPNNPPIRFDIIGARDRVKALAYSDLFKSIEYVVLRHPHDSVHFIRLAYVNVTPSSIITRAPFRAIARFDRKGNFIEEICNNRTPGLTDNESTCYFLSSDQMKDYVGSTGPVSTVGDKVYFAYGADVSETKKLMCYDASPGNRTLTLENSREQQEVKVKGEVCTELPTRSIRRLFMLDDNNFMGAGSKFRSNGYFMAITNLSGDTVCALKDHDPIENFSGRVSRNPDSNERFKYRGKIFLRQAYTDSIFEIVSSSRFVPRYVIDYGDRGFNGANDGVRPSVGLEDKFIHHSTFQTDRYFFITYTQNYRCPATASNGTLKFNQFVYDKKTGESFHTYIDQPPYVMKQTKDMPMKPWPDAPRNMFKNDMDAGIGWFRIKTSEDGTFYTSFSVEKLRKHVNSSEFDINAPNAELLKQIAEKGTLSDYVVVLMR